MRNSLGGECFKIEEYYMLWLSRVEGIGFKRANLLLEHFGSAEAIWRAKPAEIRDVRGLSDKLVQKLVSSRDEDTLNDWIIELEEKQIDFYSFRHTRYPGLLLEIYNPPVGIYVKGELPDENLDTVAIVGARKCSRYGAEVACRIAKDLARANIVVVSGMARGIDSMAHKGILDGGGKTIAVLGCGVDVCYPAENIALMERIIENGCIISEYPPGMPAVPKNFPFRNRIISGLSRIVVVVEAGKRSGTLITADLALESGRDVFVVPGNVTSALSEGTNALIKQGCPIVTEGNDILFELGIAYQENEKEAFRKKAGASLSPEEEKVYGMIEDGTPVAAETICRKLHMNIQEIQYILSLLELSGLVRKVPQTGYVRES